MDQPTFGDERVKFCLATIRGAGNKYTKRSDAVFRPSFPEEAQLFPKHYTARRYLEEYSQDIKDFIKFETQVKDVRLKNPELSTWDLTTRNLRTGTETTSMYDAVVVASGHFTVPYVPDISGIEA
ncbi:hypothetical protein N7493_010279 [Penicillium malachiteum]|uniref:Monooxygenase n=1 Tax=Penicillium malachiteum TaxID=1324776 RepID=A0AAD6HCM2_9EURO|nr:hypothetical protein N7493_010279 [Penicillium malachiteum]